MKRTKSDKVAANYASLSCRAHEFFGGKSCIQVNYKSKCYVFYREKKSSIFYVKKQYYYKVD